MTMDIDISIDEQGTQLDYNSAAKLRAQDKFGGACRGPAGCAGVTTGYPNRFRIVIMTYGRDVEQLNKRQPVSKPNSPGSRTRPGLRCRQEIRSDSMLPEHCATPRKVGVRTMTSL